MTSFMTDTRISPPTHRRLEEAECERLEKNGCRCGDWSRVRVTDATDLGRISGVDFAGRVIVGALSEAGGGELRRVRLEDVRIEDEVVVRDVPGGIKGCVIGAGARIENVARIECEPEAECGAGTTIHVLDETGSRPVWLFPGLTSQIAVLAAFYPSWAEEHLLPMMRKAFEDKGLEAGIGAGAVVRDCGSLHNVAIWPEARVEGALSLRNGMVVNNAAAGKCRAFVGSGVKGENFIIEDGCVDSGAMIRNVYVGQGARLGSCCTARDSAFFANCTLENGEACSVLAGPYVVSMHKSTLLIGGFYSFMNAGSASNASNHAYKLGPVHWGMMQRGVKTASDSYAMWGAKIGPFSLLIGSHKSHPDTSPFPFSYLIGDERGETIVVPGIMLKSCGLMRDEKKWPVRDRRGRRSIERMDNIIFDVLNPFTVQGIADALDFIAELKRTLPDADRFYRFNGLKLRASSLERAERLYRAAICKYISLKFPDCNLPEGDRCGAYRWIDLGGELLPEDYLPQLFAAKTLKELQSGLDSVYENYSVLEREWMIARLSERWGGKPAEVEVYAREFDANIEEDRRIYRAKLEAENKMLTL